MIPSVSFRVRRRLLPIALLAVGWVLANTGFAALANHWFEDFKQQASPEDLYRFLYNMPKGGDLHNHLSGSGLPEWWYEAALNSAKKGYRYYTKVRIDNCRAYENRDADYSLLFRNIQESSWRQLSSCEQGEHKLLQNLTPAERQAWLHSIELDKRSEGRDEFFGKHWQRLNHLFRNPYITNEILLLNMQTFSDEGLIYLETQSNSHGFLKPDGSLFDPNQVAALYREQLKHPDAVATGMVVRLQNAVLRFLPGALEETKLLYEFSAKNPDLYVALNLVGIESNTKGNPMHFLDTFRQLRRKYDLPLSIHAGESDGPNPHVRDTLLAGAERIGHGLNLIGDPETMRLMQFGQRMIEINLISNLLLEYVKDYSEHPFPEYLRTGIPVALATDDRGMWNSNMTDEFYVAVVEYNLSWQEILKLSRNSLAYAFLPESVKQGLLDRYNANIASFETAFSQGGLRQAARKKPVRYQFICRYYDLCEKPR